MADRAIDRHREGIELDRLGDEVVRTGADRGDGRFHAAKTGEHDHRHTGPIGHHAFGQFEARHAGHVEIGDDDVDVDFSERIKRFLRRAAGRDRASSAREAALEEGDHFGVVVDDENAAAHG